MSAVISYETPVSVIVLTDGALYDPENRITAIERKIVVSDKVPLAITGRGRVGVSDIIVPVIVQIVEEQGFDLGMQYLDLLMPDLQGHFPGRDDRCEITIAGVSETLGPRHLWFQTIPNFGEPAFELNHPGAIHCGLAGVDGLTLGDMGVRRPHAWENPEEYFTACGPEIMQFCREQKVNGAHLVGGHVDMTVVTHGRVVTRTIHKWPDKIGRRIDPFAG